MDAKEVIKRLDLRPLPEEGGYYKEIYRAEGTIPESSLPKHKGIRNYSTSIYYLVTSKDFSGLHRLASDEIFHFYMGDPVRLVKILPNGKSDEILLGSDLKKGHRPQAVVESGTWQGTKLLEGGKWALMGCVVTPGFEFKDFEIKSKGELIKEFPQHIRLIEEYTHK